MDTERNKHFQLDTNILPTKNSPWCFWFSIVTGSLSAFLMGMYNGWSIPLLPKLMEPGSMIPLTPDERSWILSMAPLVSCLTSLVTGSIANLVGRKVTLQLTTLPYLAGWLIILLTRSSTALFVSRCLSAAGFGMSSVITFLYLCEIVNTQNRGSAIILAAVFYDGAMIFMVVLGTFLQYETVAIYGLVITAMTLVVSFFVPETPYFFLLKKKHDDASKSLTLLRSLQSDDDVKKELAVMEDFVEKCSRGSFKDLFTSAVNRRGLLIGVILSAVYITSGRHVIEQYGTTIFQMSGTSIDPRICSIITTSMQFITLLVELIFRIVDRVNRRTMVLLSTWGLTVTLISMGTYFFLHEETKVDLTAVRWLPLFFGFTFIVLHVGGLGSTKPVISSEIISAENKGVAMGLMQVVFAGCDVVVLKVFQTIVDDAGVFAALWSYAACSLLGAIFFHVFLPETRGKTFLQIFLEMDESISKRKRRVPRHSTDVRL